MSDLSGAGVGSPHSCRPTRHYLPAWSQFVTIQKVLLQCFLSSFPFHLIAAGKGRSLGVGFLFGLYIGDLSTLDTIFLFCPQALLA